MPIKLFIADVDGTLVTQEKHLTDRALQAVRKLRDAGIAFATAGRYTWDTAAFQTANIENPLPYDYYTLQIYDAAAGVSEGGVPLPRACARRK